MGYMHVHVYIIVSETFVVHVGDIICMHFVSGLACI